MDAHEILIEPEVRQDASGRQYRYAAIAAWTDDAARQRGDGIERVVNGQTVRAELFNDFKVYYNPTVTRIITRQGVVETEWRRVDGTWVVESAAILIDESAQRPRERWARETFVRDEIAMRGEVQGCIDRYLLRAKQKNYTGDRRGTTLNLQVGDGADDAYESDFGSGFNSSATQILANSSTSSFARINAGMRFVAAIPVGATIDAAVWIPNVTSTANDDVNVDLLFEDVDDAANFTDTADVTSRARTTASVQWSSDGIGAGEVSSPDISAPLQEVADRGGEGDLCGFADGRDNAAKSFACWSYNGDSAKAAKLDVDYTAGGPQQKTLTPATETDAAQALAVTKLVVLSPGGETDAAQTLSIRKRVTLTPAVETDAAVALAVKTLVTLSPATETDSAQSLSIGGAQQITLTPAVETDAAVGLSIRKLVTITPGLETDAAVALSFTAGAAGGADSWDDAENGKRTIRPVYEQPRAMEEDWFTEAGAALLLLDEL